MNNFANIWTIQEITILRRLLEVAHNGRLFSVTFKKQDGTIRTLVGRCGVHSYKVDPSSPSRVNGITHLTVFEFGAGERNVDDFLHYRTVRLDSIVRFKQGKFTLNVQ